MTSNTRLVEDYSRNKSLMTDHGFFWGGGGFVLKTKKKNKHPFYHVYKTKHEM